MIPPCDGDCSISSLHLEGEGVPYVWRDTIIMITHRKKDRTECGNYRGISLVAHAGKMVQKIVPSRLK